uniref:Glycoside hydrolase family 5 domain-containing protein n=1 Tax=Chaetoceros debilis TaxID=122233 RepID=A0A7S3QGF9_9STRA
MKILASVLYLVGTFGSALSEATTDAVKAAPEVDTATKSGEGIKFKHFTAHDETHTCSADEHATPFNSQIRGVNLGGWMVLEPWITPSLFYQFLGKDEEHTGMDQFSFCEALGPEEGNKQLRRHWETWVTEEIIKELKDSGAVNSLRLPVGDWMYKPYGPYIGCTDGALDYVDKVLDWAYEYGLNVLFDIHAMRGSQNGFDNSGDAQGFKWTSKITEQVSTDVTFEHWPIRSAGWVGTFDRVTATYTDIDHDNIQHSLDVIEIMVEKYKDHPAVLGLQPVNEPWEWTPIDVLKKFYWDGYLIVKKQAPYWRYVMHDSFRFHTDVWGGFMDGCPDRVLDTHIYTAWMDPTSRENFYDKACATKSKITRMEEAFGPVIVGEWSLATDNCAMWLNGFNDNLAGFPKLPCKYTKCTDPYMGTDQPGTPVNPGKPAQGPFGTGVSTPVFGECPVDRDWHKIGADHDHDKILSPDAPHGHDASDEVMRNLAKKKINAFSGFGHGWYFWNFRTDLHEPRWSYMLALEKGWIPKGNLKADEITHACHKEDFGLYSCIVRRDRFDRDIIDGVKYALQLDDNESELKCANGATFDSSSIMNMTGDDLYLAADCAFNNFWKKHRVEGATCDLGGTAVLIEVNKTYTDDDYEDDYVEKEKIAEELKTVELVTLLLGGVLLGGIVGFIIAMRFNKGFNATVSRTNLGKSMSKSQILRRSFGGFHPSDYGSRQYSSGDSGDNGEYTEIIRT